MEKILVICEKTKQATALKEGLKIPFKTEKYANKYNKGKIPNLYYTAENLTIVAASGHLLSLYDVRDYLGRETKVWSDIADDLPYIPERFMLKPKEGGWEKGQLELICKLIRKGSFDVIYNFGDPDAEGELLIREILSFAKNTLPVKRINCKSLFPNVVADAFWNPAEESAFNGPYFEALARQQKDWLDGINLTTMLSLATKTTLRMGRVLVPITRFVYDSDKAIEEFVPTSKWGINTVLDEDTKLSQQDIAFDENDEQGAINLCQKMNNAPTTVKSVTTKKRTLKPKRLYSTSKLLAELNTLHKVSMDDGSKALQNLYLNAYITYPRTNCEFMQTREEAHMKTIVELLKRRGAPVEFHNNKSVFDDKKCGGSGEGGHTAIVITEKIPSREEVDKFSDLEKIVYSMIYRRTIANFCENAIVEDTKVVFENSGYEFILNGTVTLQEGFLKYDNKNLAKPLKRAFSEGETVTATFEQAKRTTKAPPKANSARLLYYLDHPFEKEIKDSSEDETDEFYENARKGATIGTQDTMSAITTKAIEYGYFTEDKSGYTITDLGKKLIETLDSLGIDMLNADKTIEMNITIKKVANKLMTLEESKEEERKRLLAVKEILDATPIAAHEGEVVGECPKCKSPVVETAKVFKCVNDDFVLFKNDRYLETMKKKLTKTMVTDLLEKGETRVKGLTSKKSGKKFNAVLMLVEGDNGYMNWKIKEFF